MELATPADLRRELHRVVELLPDADPAAMLDDLAGRLVLLARVRQAEADIEAGRGLSLDQVRQQVESHLATLRAKAAACAGA